MAKITHQGNLYKWMLVIIKYARNKQGAEHKRMGLWLSPVEHRPCKAGAPGSNPGGSIECSLKV